MNKKQITSLGVAIALIAIFFGANFYASAVAKNKVNEAIDEASEWVDVRYGKVSVDLFSMDVHISDVLILPAGGQTETGRDALVPLDDPQKELKISEIIVREIDEESETPLFLDVSIEGIEFDLSEPDFADLAEEMKKLGYSGKLFLNIHVDYRYDQEKQQLDIRELTAGATDVGHISIRFHLGNLNFDTEEVTEFLITYPQITLHHAEINYEDDSFMDRAVELAAK